MEMRLRAPVTRGYFSLLGASRLVNAAWPRSIDQKKISSGTQGTFMPARQGIFVRDTLGLVLGKCCKVRHSVTKPYS